MPANGCQSSQVRRESTSHEFPKDKRIFCNCGWELRLGYGVAVSLAIFEAKRFFLLALELFVDWQIIRLAGGYRPVVLTFIDITLGFPCALAAVYTIRKRQLRPSRSKSRTIFAHLLLAISACAILNILTMASIGWNISVKKRTIASVFNASMHLYVTTASYKYTVDQIQIVLQCCGHTSYTDWFLFDWQLVDYASREEMSRQERISDEIYRDRGVPFSCCNLRALGPCEHTEMSEEDARTVNVVGCSEDIGKVIVRIVFVAYAMTTILVLTQALLAFFVARLAKKPCHEELSRRFSSFSEGSCPLIQSTSSISSEKYYPRDSEICLEAWKFTSGSGEKRVSTRLDKCTGSGAVVSGYSMNVEDSTSSEMSCDDVRRHEVARIKPSVHMEHRVPRKKPGTKRIR